jgi:hypothetical protein
MTNNNASTVREIQNVDNFFNEIAYKLDGYPIKIFTYLSVKHGSEFFLLQARVLLTQGATQNPIHFESKHVRAGSYPLSELKLSPRQFVEHLTSGSLSTPHGKLCFSPNEGGSFLATYDPIHEAGQSSQSRLDVLTILGGAVREYMVRPLLDWELKASPTPYDNVQELAFECNLGALRDVINLEVVAFNVAAVDAASTITGITGQLAVRLAPRLMPKHVMLGYRVFSQGRVVKRASVRGNKMLWEKQETFQHGRAEVEVPPAAVLHCVASYRGIAQHHYWIADPTTAPNARRVVYELADNRLEILNDLLTRPQSRGRDARELETGVAWLLWMLGFSVAHLGSTPRTQDAVDLIATTPNGHFAVIECTTGLLKADQKLPRVVDRAENVRRRLAESGNRYAHVLAVIVTSKTRGEVMADIEQAERLRVLVITQEDLQQSSNRTLALPNADQLFEQAEQTVEAAAAKYEVQAELPLPSPSL